MKKVFIADINKDADVRDFFLVAKKAIYSSRNNTRYANIRLKDKTGSIEARIWDRVDELTAGFEANDIVYIESRAKAYQGELQLHVTAIRKETKDLTPDDIREFYPEAGAGTQRLREEYETITSTLENPHLVRLFDEIGRRGDLLDRFFLFPASVGLHHASIGGLAQHSLSVARMGMLTAPFTGGDRDVIAAGGLLHDVGKIEELTFRAGGFAYSDQGRLLGHITMGIVMLDNILVGLEGFPVCMADTLKHIILSHHGEAEWGSPKKPMCIEALVVHYMDNLDAKVMGVKEYMSTGMEDENWTHFHRLYESRFYRIPKGGSWR